MILMEDLGIQWSRVMDLGCRGLVSWIAFGIWIEGSGIWTQASDPFKRRRRPR